MSSQTCGNVAPLSRIARLFDWRGVSATARGRGADTAAEPASPAGRAAGPDILRAAAVLLVMAWHLPKAARAGPLAMLQPYGWLGVDVFFVLSGYLIGRQLLAAAARDGGIDLPDFYRRRALRILPAYLVVLAAYAALPFVHEARGMAPLWRFLTFTMNFGLDYGRAGTFTSAWSLCVEEHFYLVLPLLVLALRRSRDARPALAVAAAVLIGGALLRAGLYHLLDGPHGPAGPAFIREIYYPTYCRLDGLSFGVLLAALRLFRPQAAARWLPPGRAAAAGAAVLTFAVLLIGGQGAVLSGPAAVLGYPLFSLGCALCLSASLDVDATLRRFTPALVGLIATLSYSLYLTHKLVWAAMRNLGLGAGLHGWTGALAYFAVAFAAAFLLWAAVERPVLRLRDRADS